MEHKEDVSGSEEKCVLWSAELDGVEFDLVPDDL